MSRVESPVQAAATAAMPYTLEDREQFLIDTIKSKNMKLLRFLLDVEKKAPTLTPENLNREMLLNKQELFIAKFDARLAKQLVDFINMPELQNIKKDSDQASLSFLNQSKGRFLRNIGKAYSLNLFMMSSFNENSKLECWPADQAGYVLSYGYDLCLVSSLTDLPPERYKLYVKIENGHLKYGVRSYMNERHYIMDEIALDELTTEVLIAPTEERLKALLPIILRKTSEKGHTLFQHHLFYISKNEGDGEVILPLDITAENILALLTQLNIAVPLVDGKVITLGENELRAITTMTGHSQDYKIEALVQEGNITRNEWVIRLDNGEPNLAEDAKVFFIKDNQAGPANYREIMDYHDKKLQAVLNQACLIFRQMLQPLELPITEDKRHEMIAYKAEKDRRVLDLEEKHNYICGSSTDSQKGKVDCRHAKITEELDGIGHFIISMLDDHVAVPSYFEKNTLLLQKKKREDSEEYDLVGYWMDPADSRRVVKQLVPLADFRDIMLPEPGESVPDGKIFRVITAKFGCTHFDDLNYFGKNIPERLRATSDEDRLKLVWFALPIDFSVPETGDTPAHIAAKVGNFEALQLLLEHDNSILKNKTNAAGALPMNAQDENGDTLLHRAIRERKFDQIIWLLQHGADIQILNRDQKAADICAIVDPETGDTLAHIAAKNGDMPALRFLMEYNNGILKKKENKESVLPMNVQDEAGNTLLHKAVRNGELADVRCLLEQGADVYLPNAESKYALDQCILATGETLLERALANQDEVSFDFYLECGVDPLIENAQHQTILDVLFIQGRNKAISKELAVRFLELFITYFRSLSPIDIWPNNCIRAVQKFIRQEYEVYIKKGLYKIFEFYLNDVKEFIMSYMEKQLLPRIKSNWLAERPAMARLLGQHKRFEFRWSDCVDVLKALRDSVKAESPILLSERLEDIKKRFEDDQNDKRERTGPLGHSEFWEFLEYATRTYHLRVRLLEFEVLRDEMLDVQRAIEQRETDRQLEVQRLNDKITSLETQLATYKSALEAAHTEIAATKAAALAAEQRAAAAEAEAIKTRQELGDKLQEMQDQAQREKADLKEQLNATEERSRQAQEELKEQLSAMSRQAQADREEAKREKEALREEAKREKNELKEFIRALMVEKDQKREHQEREGQDRPAREENSAERDSAVLSATPDSSSHLSQSSDRGISVSSEPATPSIAQNPHGTFAAPSSVEKKPALVEVAAGQSVDNPVFS